MTTATRERLDESKWTVGTPATYSIGSDCYAAEIVNVQRYKSGKNIGKVSFVEVQISFGQVRKFTRRAHGSFLSVGYNCGSLTVGYAYEYMDPHF
jgi:hypothetical protein